MEVTQHLLTGMIFQVASAISPQLLYVTPEKRQKTRHQVRHEKTLLLSIILAG